MGTSPTTQKQSLSSSTKRALERGCSFFFLCNDTATTEIYTLSLHDALPISPDTPLTLAGGACGVAPTAKPGQGGVGGDRESTRLNSSHPISSYAVFCLNKKSKTAPFKTSDGEREHAAEHFGADSGH